ncbi:hypothetical protein PYCC9005_004388 [Savitreella phatthalungensis]
MPCSGDSSAKCGGSNRLSVYELNSPAVASTAYALGCYADNPNWRAMQTVVKGFEMTPEVCQLYCASRGYSIFGLQFSTECWCSSSVPSQGKSNSCDMQCSGSSAICGGKNALSVYTTDSALYRSTVGSVPGADKNSVSASNSASLMSSQSVLPTSISPPYANETIAVVSTESSLSQSSVSVFDAKPTPSLSSVLSSASSPPNEVESMRSSSSGLSMSTLVTSSASPTTSVASSTSSSDVYQGCFLDYYPQGRAMSGASTQSDSMTNDMCRSFCITRGFAYAATEYGRECYCSALAPTTTASNCDMKCAGGSGICGGSNALAVYKYPVMPQASAMPVVLPSNWSAVGCRSDATNWRVLTTYSYKDDQMTIQKCLSTCQDLGLNLAGLEYSTECYCGMDQLVWDQQSSSCTMPCGGDISTTCGGPNALQVYKYAGPAASRAILQSTTASGAKYSFAGCWSDAWPSSRVLKGAQAPSGNGSPGLCTSYCHSRGFPIAGIENGDQCFCDTSMLGASRFRDDACNAPCALSATALCGAANKLSVYATEGANIVAADAKPKAPQLRYKGHDISSLLMLEKGLSAAYEPPNWKWSQESWDNPPKLEQLLADAGSNTIRQRLWTSPNASAPEGTTYGLAYNIELGRRVRQSGQLIFLDIFYSDDWADPFKQVTPSLWAGLSLPDLCVQVERYTRDVLNAFVDADAPIELLSLGNEITKGFMWPLGRSVDGMSQLLAAAVRGVKSSRMSPLPKLLLHRDDGTNKNGVLSFLKGIFGSGYVSPTDFYGFASTTYPFYTSSATQEAALDTWTAVAETWGLATIVTETQWPVSCAQAFTSWQSWSSDLNFDAGDPYAMGFDIPSQRRWTYMLANTLNRVPGGKGQGLFYWEPGFLNNTAAGTTCDSILLARPQDVWWNSDQRSSSGYRPTMTLADSVNTWKEI